jgi:hypothetical protein
VHRLPARLTDLLTAETARSHGHESPYCDARDWHRKKSHDSDGLTKDSVVRSPQVFASADPVMPSACRSASLPVRTCMV